MENKNKIIGRIIATEKNPTTIDSFTFWTPCDQVLNPFDIVKVKHIKNSYTYGVIEEIKHMTDAASFLCEYISNDFGDLNTEGITQRVGMNLVTARMVYNTQDLYIPAQNNAEVYLADQEGIKTALGLDAVKNPLVCGYLTMYEGTDEADTVTLPVELDSRFLVGPEGAHLNISGISGLAAKTSYAMFLMKSIQDYYLKQKAANDSIAFVLFNVKGRDLLAIDQEPEGLTSEEKKKLQKEYTNLGLSATPFSHVHYYYPGRMDRGHFKNTYLSDEEAKKNIELGKASNYVYTYQNDRENLDLFFSNIEDPTQTVESIISLVLDEENEFSKQEDWTAFLKKIQNQTESAAQGGGKSGGKDKTISVLSWRKFHRIIRKALGDRTLFVPREVEREHDVLLGEALKKIKKNEVHVIDIAKLDEEKQAFVFGAALRTIYNLQLGEYSDEAGVTPPSKIVVFIDELNKYASSEVPKSSPILRQILDVTERGRSLGIVLFAAEQFRSAIHDRVKGNCSTHAYGRTNSIETTKGDYRSIPTVYKNMMTRLRQGEYIIQNPIFRSLVSIRFPNPIYKQFK